MNVPVNISDLRHEEIRAWLKRALHGHERLPRLTPDESPYLGILRLERDQKPAARDSLRDGCLQLVREFCADGRGEPAYLEELLCLVASFKQEEAVQMLADLAVRFPEFPAISPEVRLAVLAALVDTPPPQGMAFWEEILKQAPESYAGLVLSGVLATKPEQAVAMLGGFPDSESLGQAVALKLDLIWDKLLPEERFQFVQGVHRVLSRCGQRFAAPVRAWADSKGPAWPAVANPSLPSALKRFLGRDWSARGWNMRLCPG